MKKKVEELSSENLYTITITTGQKGKHYSRSKRRTFPREFLRKLDQRTAVFKSNSSCKLEYAQFRELCKELLTRLLNEDPVLGLAPAYDVLISLCEALALYGFTKIDSVVCEIEMADLKKNEKKGIRKKLVDIFSFYSHN